MIFRTLGLTLLLAAMAFGADVAGKWKATVSGPGGEKMQLTFDFKADGDKITGKVLSEMGEMDITDGKVEGDNLTFAVAMQDMKIAHKATVSGDKMQVQVEFGEQKMVFTAERVKP